MTLTTNELHALVAAGSAIGYLAAALLTARAVYWGVIDDLDDDIGVALMTGALWPLTWAVAVGAWVIVHEPKKKRTPRPRGVAHGTIDAEEAQHG